MPVEQRRLKKQRKFKLYVVYRKMKVKARFVLPMTDDVAEVFFQKLGMCIPEEGRKIGLYVLEPELHSDFFVCITNTLHELGIDCGYTEEREYTKRKMENTPLFMITPLHCRAGYPQPEKEYLSISFNSADGCPFCSNGRLQTAPLHLCDSIRLGKADITGVEWTNELVVSARAREIIEQAGVSGCTFWELIAQKSNKPFEAVFQLKITGQLPPMAEETVFSESQAVSVSGFTFRPFCPNGCGEKSLKSLPYYHAHDLENIPDFAVSSEWIGGGRGRFRLPFASQKVYRLFRENKLKGLRFEPVMLIP